MNIKQKAKLYARIIADKCIRNDTILEELHGGTTPSSQKGDFSDVKVVTPYGEIPWKIKKGDKGWKEETTHNGVPMTIFHGPKHISHISDEEIHELMVKIEKNLQPYILMIMYLTLDGKIKYGDKPIKESDLLKEFKKFYFGEYGVSWNIPKKEFNRLSKKNE